jgi:hypothetical protein
MELNKQNVAVFLKGEGRSAVELAAGISMRDSPMAYFYVLESDGTGLWVSTRKQDGEHQLLIPWDCILAVDVPVGGTPVPESVA